MLQPVCAFNSTQFNRVPLHRQAFFPFGQGLSGRSQSEACKQDHHFLNLRMVFEQDQRYCHHSQSAQHYIPHPKGHIQFVYGWDDSCVDVVLCAKSTRCRFLIPNPKSEPFSVQIKCKLLVIMSSQSLYIHDLIRHNSRLMENPIQGHSLSQISILTLSRNQHFLYCAALQNKMFPTLELKLYGIDMSNNFSVELTCTKYLTFCEDNYPIKQFSTAQNGTHLDVFATLQSKAEMFIYVGRVQKRQTQESQDWVAELNRKIQLHSSVWQADSYLITECSSFWHQSYSGIRSSWFQPDRRAKPSWEKQDQLTPISHLSTQSYSLLFKRNSQQIIVIQNCVQATTRIIEHSSKIIDIIYYKEEIAYLLDEDNRIWEYDFQEYEEDILGYTCQISLDLTQTLHSLSLTRNLSKSTSNLGQSPIRIQIWCSTGGRLGIVIDGQFGYVGYPFFMTPPQLQNKQDICTEQGRTFLSIQSEFFEEQSLVLSQKNEYFLMPQLSPFWSYSASRLQTNILHKITLEVLPVVKSNLLLPCQFFRNLEIQSALEFIFSSLESIKMTVLGTIYDCEANNFYWLLAGLWMAKGTPNQLGIVLNFLIDELNQSAKVLQILLSERQFKSWLLSKTNPSFYPMVCTTNFQKCGLISGCPCIFKRILKRLIGSAGYEKKNGNFHKDYQFKQQIIGLLQQGDDQQLCELANQREDKIYSEMSRKHNRVIDEVDEKWVKQFQDLKDKESPDFSFDRMMNRPVVEAHQDLIIVYHQSEEYQNRLFRNCQSVFVQKVLKLEEKMKTKKLKKELLYCTDDQLFLQMYQLCADSDLIFNPSPFIRQKWQKGSEQKQFMCLAVIGSIFRIFIQKFQQVTGQKGDLSATLQSLSQSRQTFQERLRKYWILLICVQCKCISLKYPVYPEMLETIIKSIKVSKLIPEAADRLRDISKCGLQTEEYLALVGSWWWAEKFRFENEFGRTSLQSTRFRYSQHVWEKGIVRIKNMYEMAVNAAKF